MNQTPTKTALLLIDIQNDYFENGKMSLVGSDAAANNAKRILEKFRTDNLPVVHIQHIAIKPTATFFLPGTEGSEIHSYVKPVPPEKVIVKHFPNSFRETELLGYLRKSEITDLVVCGMMTHMCVDATVRAAKDFGFNITLIADACATKDLEINGNKAKATDVQTSFLAALNQTYAKIELTGNYLLS
jgi:nicotinamidase-related amidase